MVNAEYRLVTEVFRLERLYAVMGISMGGMQAFQWIVTYPEFVDRAIPIVGTPRQTSYDLLLWNTQLRVIEALRHSQGGENMAMQLLPLISALAIDTPQYRASQTKPEEFQQYLAAQLKEQAGRNVYDWASQLRAMIGHDIYKSFGGSEERTAAAIRARGLIIVAEQDHMVNPTPALELAKLLKAETLALSSDCGHMAVVCELEKVQAAVARFLEK
jgi:homoserine O-acetyltransferase